ncbi:BTAD domain-containing putative transcriptional regulator [Micromonospora sp. WMMD964]|uniref:BTAD domain-containing putative transcriptional regulator n=1 Tax=Micromonospora sp. WMMD964 TaxID=3016091 RepID=UPI00249CBC6E|nr:BTAD domain-containing putative transcriptional regulator [Micromonospora sp. WMMD964]WFF03668.1 BTAD domain-containing putative transcriptional regulator [Micromonospora sp. WMMD964]
MGNGTASADAPKPPSGRPTVGRLLRTYRLHSGLTQRELAVRAGLSIAALRDLEQGRSTRPRHASVVAIAAALGLDDRAREALHTSAAAATRAYDPRPVVDPGAPVQIRVLGPLELRRGNETVAVSSATQRVLLAKLALGAPEPVPRDSLRELLRGRYSLDDATKLLRTHLTRLRRLVEPSGQRLIVPTPSGYRLVATAEQLDLAQLRQLAAQARDASPEYALTLLARAAELWRGGCDLDELAGDPLLTSVTEEYATLLRRFAEVARDVSEPERPLPRLRELADRLEFHEPLHTALIVTLAASGRQAEALAAYQRVRANLREQLGLDPGELLRDAHVGVLRQRGRVPGRATRNVVQQLPAAPAGFVGREPELARIVAAVARTGHELRHASSRVVLVHGAAGSGKTALAHTAGHRLRLRYPGGQLYADLGGASAEPASPTAVLGRFLRALGVPVDRIGGDLVEDSALLRTELAGRRMLVVLDNASDAAQVLPLLPGTGRSDVLVTSRWLLRGLEVAASVPLGTLTAAESLEMIAAAAGGERVAADARSARELTGVCGHLPLALRIAGARLASRPSWAIGDLVQRLRDESGRLAQLDDGSTSVLASFQLSYDSLSEPARRAFRLCALHPAQDFGVTATGALLDTDDATAERILDELLDANMLLQYSAHRFRFHDLLRLYAGKLVEAEISRSRHDAFARLLASYAERVTAAMDWVLPQMVRLSGHSRPEGQFPDEKGAAAWLAAETTALVLLAEQAARDDGLADFAWRIADQLRGYFLVNPHVDGWTRIVGAGWSAAERSADRRARAAMLMSRGQVRSMVGRDLEGLEDALTALRLAQECGWDAAAAYLSHNIGWQYYEFGRLADAETWFGRALDLTASEPLGHIRATVLNGIGMIMLDRGRCEDAATSLTAALEINKATGRARSALVNRGNLASVLRQRGELVDAAEQLDTVLRGYRRRGDLRGELSTLDEMSRLEIDRRNLAIGLSLARQAHDLAVKTYDRRAQTMTAGTLGNALRENGEIAQALDVLRDGVAMARRHSYRYLETRARVGLAGALALAGEPDAARHEAGRAERVAHDLGFGTLATEARAIGADPPAPD